MPWPAKPYDSSDLWRKLAAGALHCTCGIGDEYAVGHSDWCDYLEDEVTEPAGHVWGTYSAVRGKHGAWVCDNCGLEVFRLFPSGSQTAPFPDCPGKKP